MIALVAAAVAVAAGFVVQAGRCSEDGCMCAGRELWPTRVALLPLCRPGIGYPEGPGGLVVVMAVAMVMVMVVVTRR